MADIKFSEFPKAATSKDSDEIAILQDGVNKMIASPVLESKIINKTVSRVIEQGGASLNLINLKGVVATYADLALITPTPELTDAYQVEADGLVYVYTENGFQSDGDGFVVQPNVNGVVEEGNTNAVSGGEVYNSLLTKTDVLIYSLYPVLSDFDILKSLKDFNIVNGISGYTYSLYIGNLNEVNSQQLTIFKYDSNDLTEPVSFSHFRYSETIDFGIKQYKTTFETGEICNILINWDLLTDTVISLTPNEYVLKDDVFKGGLISNFLKGEVVKNNENYINGNDVFENLINKVDTFIFKEIPENAPSKNLNGIVDFNIQNKRIGFFYDLYIGNLNDVNAQQLTIFCYADGNHSEYVSFAHLKYSDSDIDTGVNYYEANLSTGEYVRIYINWDIIGVLKITLSEYFGYIFKDSVFEGGNLSNLFSPLKQPKDIYWAACGDSITNANHGNIYDIEENDPYMPIDGYQDLDTYKRKNYAYYIAKDKQLKWANYGYGGTTLTDCHPKAFPDDYLFPFVNDRIEDLKEDVDWDYITIFFGWNDAYYNPYFQRDLWLTDTYGVELGYPKTPEQIGAVGFADLSQKNACDAVTGTVGGVLYDNSEDYFFAKFIGEITDSTKSTWYGAYNYALSYLLKKYQKSKILIVAPFIETNSDMIINATKNIAEKWGVSLFDFEDLPYWYYKTNKNNTVFLNPNEVTGIWKTENGYECTATVEGFNQSRMSYDSLHPSNLGYKTFYPAFAEKLFNK